MRILFTVIVVIFAFFQSFAQERTVSGRLTSHEDGSPLPGVNISIKGTSIGTVTDADGYYSLRVPIGATLIFAFVGMQTREVVVTENNLQPGKGTGKVNQKNRVAKTNPRPFFKDSTSKPLPGVSVLTDQTPTYHAQSNLDPSAIRSIKRLRNRVVIRSDLDPVRRTGFGLQITSSLGIETINRLPSFQNSNAQGQPTGGGLMWRGPDQQELFSWGPLIKTLEFDGSNYSYDKNGRLVPAGTGNGKPSRAYDATSFFRSGLTAINELTFTKPGPKNAVFVFDLENRSRTGIIPNSDYRKLNFSSNLKNYQLSGKMSVNASVSFNRSSGHLLSRGGNIASIVGSLYRTPPTFDNANALPFSRAVNSPESYGLPDGTHRSHAPGLTDNPVGLINELPDHEKLQRLITSLNFVYRPSRPFTVNFNGNVDRQWGDNIFGIPPGYSGYPTGRLTDRKDYQTLATAIVTPSYSYTEGYRGNMKLSLSYQSQYSGRQLDRRTGIGFSNGSFGDPGRADVLVTLHKNLSRTVQEITTNAQFEYDDWINVRLSNRNYFSTTVNPKKYVNLFPAASLGINMARLLDLYPIEDLNLYVTISRTIREAPLLYSNWSYESTRIPIENYNSFYEANELFFTSILSPETERKFESGLKFQGFNGRLTCNLVYFSNRTADFITPVWNGAGFQLQNAAVIRNYGGTLSAGYSNGLLRQGTWGTDLRWSRYNSLVTEIYSADEWIPLAGFTTPQSVLSPGKPFGAIYGTSYLRNNQGKRVIGNDGFPIKDSNLKMIGSPIPDWMLGWSAFFQWKQLRFSFLVDYKKGGKIWNGTNAVLDYLGRSSNSGNLRNTSNYVFEGVDGSGNVNTIPVSFADSSKPLSDNRWVRYGWEGIGEDYMEDASFLRLSEMILSYSIKRNFAHASVREIKFSLIGRNLLLITPYRGVDPAATLFSYGNGNGLDLFNAPSTRSYGAQITIKL